LVTDVVMPQMGGGELARHVRAERPEIRVLFVSGFTDDAVLRHGVLHDELTLLQKPFEIETLLACVREALGAPAESLAPPQERCGSAPEGNAFPDAACPSGSCQDPAGGMAPAGAPAPAGPGRARRGRHAGNVRGRRTLLHAARLLRRGVAGRPL